MTISQDSFGPDPAARSSRPGAGLRLVDGWSEDALISAPPADLEITTSPSVSVAELVQESSRYLRTLGTVNILVAGQTGVGKSTLINSVFGQSFADTAAGEPVTQRAEWFSSDTIPLRILDTRGLEVKDYGSTLQDVTLEIERCRAERSTRDQLHIAWICIAAPSSRVQDCEIDIVRVLNKHAIPVVLVLTKDDDDVDFPNVVAGIMARREAHFASIVSVRALSRANRPASGLAKLVIETLTALPAAHRSAFSAAQKVNRDLSRSAADEYVMASTAAAAASAIVPIPFADIGSLACIQTSMLVAISTTFGLSLGRSQVMQLLTAVLGCLALSTAGAWLVGSVMKLVPGPGSVVGAALNSTVAAALTRTLGKTYIRFLYAFVELHGRVPSGDEIVEFFPAFFKSSRQG